MRKLPPGLLRVILLGSALLFLGAVICGGAAHAGTLYPGDCEQRAEKWWGMIARMESIDPDHYEPRFSRDLQSFVAGYCWREMFH